MAPKIDQGTLIILDIGRNASTSDEKKGKTFFQEARECAAKIIERKILNQGKSMVGVVLLGSKKTKNSMAEQCPGAFKHIEMLAELQTPTWQMIRDLPENGSSSRGDWLDALVVAADHFKNGVSNVKIENKKVVLMTNFNPPSKLQEADFEQVLNGFKTEQFEVDVIGPDIYDESQKCEDFSIARQFVEETNGATAPFHDTMQYLTFHRRKNVKAMPWNVDLSIGPNVKIPVSAMIKLRDEPLVKNWQKAVKDPISNQASSNEGIMRNRIHINVENQETVEQENVIKGYQYGQKVIPFTEDDKSMLYMSGDKCLSVYGFTDASNVTWQHLSGDGLFYIFGRKGDKKAQNALRCLVECLHERKLVGIVRRVYNKNNAPRMFAIMPVIDAMNNLICLSMAGISFNDEIKNMAFPPTNLKKYSCTDEQVDAFKDLIKAMDLTKAYDDAYDDSEAFPIAQTVSPSVQYILDCLAFRALNPGKPLPQPRDEIMTLFKQPALIQKRAQEPLDKLKKLFTLNKVEKKTRRKNTDIVMDVDTTIKTDNDSNGVDNQVTAGQDMPKVVLPVKKADEITKIGTVDPINNFKELQNKGKSLDDLSKEFTEVIETLFYSNLDGTYSKALDTIKFFRAECVKGNPSHYNDWLQNFKKVLNDRKKLDILEVIVCQAGFIIKDENSLSTYEAQDSHDDSQLYENDTVPNTAELTIQSEVNDLFDDM